MLLQQLDFMALAQFDTPEGEINLLKAENTRRDRVLANTDSAKIQNAGKVKR